MGGGADAGERGYIGGLGIVGQYVIVGGSGMAEEEVEQVD